MMVKLLSKETIIECMIYCTMITMMMIIAVTMLMILHIRIVRVEDGDGVR